MSKKNAGIRTRKRSKSAYEEHRLSDGPLFKHLAKEITAYIFSIGLIFLLIFLFADWKYSFKNWTFFLHWQLYIFLLSCAVFAGSLRVCLARSFYRHKR